jgi:hypothetical protein
VRVKDLLNEIRGWPIVRRLAGSRVAGAQWGYDERLIMVRSGFDCGLLGVLAAGVAVLDQLLVVAMPASTAHPPGLERAQGR